MKPAKIFSMMALLMGVFSSINVMAANKTCQPRSDEGIKWAAAAIALQHDQTVGACIYADERGTSSYMLLGMMPVSGPWERVLNQFHCNKDKGGTPETCVFGPKSKK